jgi:hypothetical protein
MGISFPELYRNGEGQEGLRGVDPRATRVTLERISAYSLNSGVAYRNIRQPEEATLLKREENMCS